MAKRLVIFSAIIVLILPGYQSVRVKHSEYVKSRWVPEDDLADWPSPDQVYFELGESLDGDVILPGGWDYRNGSLMWNLRFNSKFGAIVYAESASDVQKAILFAREYGIRPTVYSTGHEFLGRSARDHTLSINLRRMRQMDVNLNDPRSDTNMTMTVGTGLSWADVYAEADRNGVILLGGSCPSVGPGGYTLGGGHSPVTRMKGLGADQVVEFTMVTANGSIVNMNQEGGTMEHPDGGVEEVTDPDLWWAVLGGGGGVYGVVTQFVLKLHAAPDGFVSYIVQWEISTEGECPGAATEALELFLDLLRTNLTNNWGGYILPIKTEGDGGRVGVLLFSLLHWGRDEEEAMSILDEFSNFRTDCQDFSFVTVYDTFWEYQQLTDQTGYGRNHLVSIIAQEEDCEPGSGMAQMITDFVSAPELGDFYVQMTGIITGGYASELPQEANSVSPEFRNGLASLVFGVYWLLENDDEEAVSSIVQYANDHIYQHGTGSYYSESDFYLQNWQVEYWGSGERYQRLLDVKQRWDPDNMFWCHHCVGSEF